MEAVTSTPANGEIKVVAPTDQEALSRIAQHIAKQKFWEDGMLFNIGETFQYAFMNPNAFVVEIAEAGVLSFVTIHPRMRARLYGVMWSPRAMRKPELWRTAGIAAFEALELHVIEALTSWDNSLARKAMEAGGMTFKGRIKDALCYSGVVKDAAWYEATRADAGLPPIE